MTQAIKDAAGRVLRLREVDDRGERFPIIQSGPANLLGIGEYTEVFRVVMERARRGELIQTLSITADPALAGFINLWADVRIVGWCGGAGQIVDSFTLDRFGMNDYRWDDPESWEALSIEARMNVDGVVTSTALFTTALLLNVSGAYWR